MTPSKCAGPAAGGNDSAAGRQTRSSAERGRRGARARQTSLITGVPADLNLAILAIWAMSECQSLRTTRIRWSVNEACISATRYFGI